MALEHIKQIEKEGALNHVISKSINIDEGLYCYISVSNTNLYTVNLITNKIIDSILENITDKDKNVYGNFSYSLDAANMFIANLQQEGSNINNLSVIVWVRHKEKFYFSKMWEASCVLYSKWVASELSYMPDRGQKRFDYISNWDLKHGDCLFMSNTRLFNYFTKSDIVESAELETTEKISSNLEDILFHEERNESIDIITAKFENYSENLEKEETFGDKMAHFGLIMSDNKFVKGSIAYFLLTKEFIEKQNKHLKTSLLLVWIIVCFGVLYNIIWGVVSKSMENQNVLTYELKLAEAEKFKEIAYQNINSPENFNLNVKKAEDLLAEIKSENLFIDDVNKMTANINIMKKEFNGIETFSPNYAEKIYEWALADSVKIIYKDWRTYVVNKTSITGAIINGESTWNYAFEAIWNDEFIDASYDDVRKRIMLLTNKWRIVSYDLKGNFKYQKISWENEWPKASVLRMFRWNIYLLDEKQNQIYKHTPAWGGFAQWVSYLKDVDMKNYANNKINSIDIDGWIYMLREDLVLEKFFSNPYTIKWIRLNKLPKNYDLKDKSKSSKIIARNDLNFVYFFFDNTIWIFKPNSKNWQDVSSLEFLGQIEWANESIKDIYVTFDDQVWEIFVVYSSGIYKLKFDITDDWITIL